MTGMHCASCASLIEESLTEQPGVKGARVDLASGRARIEFDPAGLRVEDLCRLIADTGYGAAPATQTPSGD